MRGPCVEILDLGQPSRRCGRPGLGVSLSCPAGRPNAEAGPYCEAHGGEARAQHEAERAWDYVAPASVGDSEAVLEAGCMQLTTRDAYVVVRAERGYWLAFLGVGSIMVGVPNPATCATWERGTPAPKGVPHRKRGEPSEAWRARCATVGSYRFPDRQAAEAEGRLAWRASVDQHVAEIRAARGGTLDWGVPVAPLAAPIVVDATDRNAWDAVASTPRQATHGICGLSGNRPSGEAA